LLPDEILWRKKEAFSDGVSKKTRSLFTIIQEWLDKIEPIPAPNMKNWLKETATRPDTPEKQYYRSIYETLYPGINRVVPYYWMPKYIEANDPSARTLDIYDSPTDDKEEPDEADEEEEA
jgi:asparagine synthase (glutamine-hydrolysing)